MQIQVCNEEEKKAPKKNTVERLWPYPEIRLDSARDEKPDRILTFCNDSNLDCLRLPRAAAAVIV